MQKLDARFKIDMHRFLEKVHISIKGEKAMINIKRMTALLMSAILMGSTVCVPAMAAEVTGEEQVVLQEEGTKQEEDLETDSTADSETEGETTELPEDLESGRRQQMQQRT